jgi:hypothetical protein
MRRKGLGQTAEQSVQETRSDDGRDDRNEYIAQRLDARGRTEFCFCAAASLADLLGSRLNTGDRDELIKDLVHRAGAKDDLQLAGCLKASLNAVNVLDCLPC